MKLATTMPAEELRNRLQDRINLLNERMKTSDATGQTERFKKHYSDMKTQRTMLERRLVSLNDKMSRGTGE